MIGLSNTCGKALENISLRHDWRRENKKPKRKRVRPEIVNCRDAETKMEVCCACVRTARAVRTKRRACMNARTVRGFDSALLASCFIACRAKSALRVATILLGCSRRGSRAGGIGVKVDAGGSAVGSLEAGNLVDENGEEGAEGMDVAGQRGLVLIGVMAVGERVSASFVVVSDQVAWTVNGRCLLVVESILWRVTRPSLLSSMATTKWFV